MVRALASAFAFLLSVTCGFGQGPSIVQFSQRWEIYSFGCDTGHENYGPLFVDGTPACGNGNCPGPPGLPGQWH